MPNKSHNIAIVTFAAVLATAVVFVGILLILNKPSTVTEVTLSAEKEIQLQTQIAPLIASGDLSTCDQVQNKMYRSVCINNIALQKAEETNDISYCQYLDGELISKETCERQVVIKKSLEQENVTICLEATDEAVRVVCTNSYPVALAMKKNDPNMCNQALDPSSCVDQYELSNLMKDPNSATCSNFSSDEAKIDCVALQSLFVMEEPDVAELIKVCSAVTSVVFESLCVQLNPPAMSI